MILYQVAGPILTKVLERSLHKIDQAVTMPERGMRVQQDTSEEVSLYDVEIGDVLEIKPGEQFQFLELLLKEVRS